MSAEVELISTMGEKKSWNRPPIQMEFQVILLTPMEGETCLFSLCFILSIAIWNWIWIVAESLNIHSLFMNCAWSYKKLSFVVFVIGILFQGIAFYCHVQYLLMLCHCDRILIMLLCFVLLFSEH